MDCLELGKYVLFMVYFGLQEMQELSEKNSFISVVQDGERETCSTVLFMKQWHAMEVHKVVKSRLPRFVDRLSTLHSGWPITRREIADSQLLLESMTSPAP